MEPSPEVDVAEQAATEPAPAEPETAPEPGPMMGLSAPEAVEVLMTVNEGEIATARQALDRVQAEAVKAFAQQMITEHEAMNARLTSLAQAQGLAPQDNELARQLKEQAQSLQTVLTEIDPAMYDQAYLTSQLQMHAQTLQLLDQVLMPNVTEPQLDAMLTELRPMIEAHLAQAQTLLQQATEGAVEDPAMTEDPAMGEEPGTDDEPIP